MPSEFAENPERMARFKREAQLLASLNHPNIAAIYGLEESGGMSALIMELAEGPTLADRISRGPIALDEALSIARQITEALEAVHIGFSFAEQQPLMSVFAQFFQLNFGIEVK